MKYFGNQACQIKCVFVQFSNRFVQVARSASEYQLACCKYSLIFISKPIILYSSRVETDLMPLETPSKLAYVHADGALKCFACLLFMIRVISFIKQQCHNKSNRTLESKRSLISLLTHADITKHQNRLSTIIYEIKNSLQLLGKRCVV